MNHLTRIATGLFGKGFGGSNSIETFNLTPFRSKTIVYSLTIVLSLALQVFSQESVEVSKTALAMPLSSVGAEVGWMKGGSADDYRIRVSDAMAGKPISISLFSPDINVNDYTKARNPNQLGDEIYGKNQLVTSRFALVDSQGKILAEETFGMGDLHRTFLFFTGQLPVGLYELRVETKGKGKNAFGVQVSKGLALEASQFTVVTRGKFGLNQLAARFTINSSAIGRTLQLNNYDGDGTKELELFVREPGGKIQKLLTSGDVKWASLKIKVTPKMVGEWAILAKILPTTKQYSNSFVFRLRLDGNPYFVRSATTVAREGFLELRAVSDICGRENRIESSVEIDGVTYVTGQTIALPVGRYKVSPKSIVGSNSTPVEIEVNESGTQLAKLVYGVDSEISISPVEAAAKLGESIQFKLSLKTQFPFEVPVEAKISWPKNLSPTTSSFAGVLSSDKELVWEFPALAVESGEGTILATGCASQTISRIFVEAPVEPKSTDLAVIKSVDPSTAEPGGFFNFSIVVSNLSNHVARDVVLDDVLPSGLTFVSSSEKSIQDSELVRISLGDIQAGERKEVRITTRVDLAGDYTNLVSVHTSTLESNYENNQGRASVKVSVRPVADLAITKIVNNPTPKIGQAVLYTLEITNLGNASANDVTLTDLFPNSLEVVSSEPVSEKSRTGAIDWKLGTIAAGETRTVKVEARVLTHGLVVNTARVSTPTPEARLENNLATVSINVKPKIEGFRESQVVLASQLNQPFSSGYVILSDLIPANSFYKPGTSQQILSRSFDAENLKSNPQLIPAVGLTGLRPIPDPIAIGSRLYWVLPATNFEDYGVKYTLSHSQSIQFSSDSIGVILASASQVGLAPSNPLAKSWIGQVYGIYSLQQVRGNRAVLSDLLSLNATELPLYLQNPQKLGGETAAILVEPVYTQQMLPALLITILDQEGKPANGSFVTFTSSAEPLAPDASPRQPGYQISMNNGQALVELREFGSNGFGSINPSETVVSIRAGQDLSVVADSKFSITDFRRVVRNLPPVAAATEPKGWLVAGAASAQIDIPSADIAIDGNAFAHGPVGDAKLTLATGLKYLYNDSLKGFEPTNLLPNLSTNEFLLGDSSVQGREANSSDGFYAKLEQGDDYLQYGQSNTEFEGLLGSYNQTFNGIKGVANQANEFSLKGFVTPDLLPDHVEYFSPDGTSNYWLQGITNGSLSNLSSPNAPAVLVSVDPKVVRVMVESFDLQNERVAARVLEIAKGEFAVDALSGRIQIKIPVSAIDANGFRQYIRVEYGLVDRTANWLGGSYRFGVQGSLRTGNLTTGATILKSSSENDPLVSVSASYQADGFGLLTEVGYSGNFGDSATFGIASRAILEQSGLKVTAHFAEKGVGFIDPYTGKPVLEPGRNIEFGLGYKITPEISLGGNLASHSALDSTSVNKFSANGQLEYDLGELRVSAGLATESSNATANKWATFGIASSNQNQVSASVLHRMALDSVTVDETVASLEYALDKAFRFYVRDTLTYLDGLSNISHQGSFGLRGTFENGDLIRTTTGNNPLVPGAFGISSVSADYFLPTLAGDTGRVVLGANTEIPLGNGFGATLRGSVYTLAGGIVWDVGTGLSFAGDAEKIQIRADYSHSALGLKQIYTGTAAVQIDKKGLIAPKFEFSILPSGETGLLGSFGVSLRLDDWSVYGTESFRSGTPYTLTGPEIGGNIQFAYVRFERLFWRGGFAHRVTQGVMTGQIGTGVNYFVTDELGIEANVAYAFQTPTNYSGLLFGLGASYRFAPGLAISAGYNATFSIDPLPYLDQKPGLYLRLDWIFDENTFGLGR